MLRHLRAWPAGAAGALDRLDEHLRAVRHTAELQQDGALLRELRLQADELPHVRHVVSDRVVAVYPRLGLHVAVVATAWDHDGAARPAVDAGRPRAVRGQIEHEPRRRAHRHRHEMLREVGGRSHRRRRRGRRRGIRPHAFARPHRVRAAAALGDAGKARAHWISLLFHLCAQPDVALFEPGGTALGAARIVGGRHSSSTQTHVLALVQLRRERRVVADGAGDLRGARGGGARRQAQQQP